MSAIVIDAGKCTGCGECAADCVSRHIVIEGGRARALDNACIECGHCYAICPAGAVSMPGYDCAGLEGTAAMSEFDPGRLLLAMQSRRSIRRFRPEPVSREDVERILSAGRFCPTGSNRQGLHFVIISERLEEAERAAARSFLRVKRLASLVSRTARETDIDGHFFFKGAPLAIAVCGRDAVSASLASAYMELLAESLGLGVLYSGFFVFAAKHSPELAALLALPDGVEPVTTLCIGRTDVSYPRRAPRKPLNVTWR